MVKDKLTVCYYVYFLSLLFFFNQDYFTIGKQQPKMDAKQDVTLDMAEQKDDYTTLMFHRKLKTGDSEYDVNIEVRPLLTS